LRSEEIYKKVPLKPDLAKKALTKLREDERVKTTGEKRAMTYTRRSASSTVRSR